MCYDHGRSVEAVSSFIAAGCAVYSVAQEASLKSCPFSTKLHRNLVYRFVTKLMIDEANRTRFH